MQKILLFIQYFLNNFYLLYDKPNLYDRNVRKHLVIVKTFDINNSKLIQYNLRQNVVYFLKEKHINLGNCKEKGQQRCGKIILMKRNKPQSLERNGSCAYDVDFRGQGVVVHYSRDIFMAKLES